MRGGRNEDKLLPYFFMVAADWYAEKGRQLRDTEEKKTVSSDDGCGN
jgi:hypothetical protein